MKIDTAKDTCFYLMSKFLPSIHVRTNIYGYYVKKWLKVGRIIVASAVGN